MNVVEMADLKKSFGKDEILKGVNLQIEEKKLTVIIGFSGAGKSVLLKTILGILKPTSGKLSILGQDISHFDQYQWNEVRKNFGMLFQYSALFDSMTVYDNIAFPLREHTKLSEREIEKTIHELMASVGLENCATKYPSEISGGMRKRVALARAIALKPKILLYDEPTTGLDPIMTEVVDDLILDTQKRYGITSIVISHDLYGAFRIADKICFLHEGKILLEGPKETFFKTDDPLVKRFIKNVPTQRSEP